MMIIGGIELDRERAEARCSGRLVPLRASELQIFAVLMAQPGKVFSREQLVAEVWGEGADIDVRTIDQQIRRIRSAVNRGNAPDPIRSVRGQGYKFSETYETEYADWLARDDKRMRLSEIMQKRKRVGIQKGAQDSDG